MKGLVQLRGNSFPLPPLGMKNQREKPPTRRGTGEHGVGEGSFQLSFIQHQPN